MHILEGGEGDLPPWEQETMVLSAMKVALIRPTYGTNHTKVSKNEAIQAATTQT